MSEEEIVAIVDESGTVQSSVPRSQLSNEHAWQIISVWIENDKGKVLLQQRSWNKKLGPGLWTCAVEGTVTGNDDFDQTAYREVAEEIGLTDIPLTPTKKVFYKADHGSRLAQGYTAKCNWPVNKFQIQEEEVEQLSWVPKAQVIQEILAKDPKYPTSAIVWLDMFNLQ